MEDGVPSDDRRAWNKEAGRRHEPTGAGGAADVLPGARAGPTGERGARGARGALPARPAPPSIYNGLQRRARQSVTHSDRVGWVKQ